MTGAKHVAKLCNGPVKQFVLSRKISKDIDAVRSNLLAFSVANNIDIGRDLSCECCRCCPSLTYTTGLSTGVQRESVV